MRILQENPGLTQRELVEKLRISVGGLNYCLKALIEKGLVKIKNLSTSKKKFGDVCVVTQLPWQKRRLLPAVSWHQNNFAK